MVFTGYEVEGKLYTVDDCDEGGEKFRYDGERIDGDDEAILRPSELHVEPDDPLEDKRRRTLGVLGDGVLLLLCPVVSSTSMLSGRKRACLLPGKCLRV